MITISKELGHYSFRGKWWLEGYPVRFRKEADRRVFGELCRWVLLKPNRFIRRKDGRKCWQLADTKSGATWFNNTTRKGLEQHLRLMKAHWQMYRLILVCRIDLANNVGPEKWGATKDYSFYTDEFNALLVAAKMEGLTNKSTLKDITDAISNTTTAAVAS